MPYSEKITISRDGSVLGTTVSSSNPEAVTLIDGLATIKWGDTLYAVPADSERLLGTRYKFTMPNHLIGIFIPVTNTPIEAINIRPTIVKNGDSLKVPVINFNGSVTLNISAETVLGYMIFVDGKTILA